MKEYRCFCSFKTGSRKEIRKHVRDVHGIKGSPGGHGHDTPASDISMAYHTVER